MKIIAGCARNAELLSPPDIGVRPTAVRSRKALFDSIGVRLNGAAVLDLFSGSGALGL
jgi:16S rRNA (guanine966-N2)-methyltransferase